MSTLTKKILLATMSVVVALALAEVVLRVMGIGELTPEASFGVNTKLSFERGWFVPDDGLFWKMPPSPQDADWRFVHPDRPLPPRGQAPRVLVLGDSCSKLSGEGPPFSVLLEDSLGGGVEVWNASVPGYTTHQGLKWYRAQLRDLGADVVVVYFGWNDHWRTTGMTDRDYEIRRASRALRLLRLFSEVKGDPPLRVPPDDYRANLEKLVAEITADGAGVLLVAAPGTFEPRATQRLVQFGYLRPGDNPRVLHERYLRILGEVAGAHDDAEVGLVDVARAFRESPAEPPLLLGDGTHLTDDGHRVVAGLLAVELRCAAGGVGP